MNLYLQWYLSKYLIKLVFIFLNKAKTITQAFPLQSSVDAVGVYWYEDFPRKSNFAHIVFPDVISILATIGIELKLL